MPFLIDISSSIAMAVLLTVGKIL